jgi:hypothetical protein
MTKARFLGVMRFEVHPLDWLPHPSDLDRITTSFKVDQDTIQYSQTAIEFGATDVNVKSGSFERLQVVAQIG